MKSDPCACPNEWWHNLRQHHQMHVPPESRTNYDWRERVSRVSAPTLVVHGTDDLIPLEASQEWAATLPKARLLTLEGSGHFPHLEDPEAFFPAVEAFLCGEWPVA
jgi:pimeloyl-ACP methyl ester carboxylesterase